MDGHSDSVWTLSSGWLVIAFPERGPDARRKRVVSPPAPFVSVLIYRDAGGMASPASFSIGHLLPGAGRSGFDEQLASSRPQTVAFLQPRIRLGYISMRAPGSQARERMPMSTMDNGLLPPRDELSTSCAIYCLESELYFYCRFLIPHVTGVLTRL